MRLGALSCRSLVRSYWGWSEPAVVVRHSRPERCLPPFDDRGDNEGPERPELCLSQLARIFGKFLANGFLSEGAASGKSEDDRINTG